MFIPSFTQVLGFLIASAWSCSYASVDTKFQSLQNNPAAMYAFLKAMPKGGELHYHYDGAVFTETMLQETALSNLCVDSLSLSAALCQDPHARPINKLIRDDLYEGATFATRVIDIDRSSKLCTHLPMAAESLCQNPQAIPIYQISRKPRLLNNLTDAWSMKNFYSEVTTVPVSMSADVGRVPEQLPSNNESAPDHFFKIFSKIGTIYAQESLKGGLLAKILQKAADQHELYLEIMAFGLNEDKNYTKLIRHEKNFFKKTAILLADPRFQHSVEQIVTQSKRFLPAAHNALHCGTQHSAACDIQVNFQFYVRRVKSLDSVFAQALAGFVAAEHAPKLVGINLVDREDGKIAQRDYIQQMQIFNFLHHQFPKARIALHAGELYPKQVANHSVISPIRSAILIGQAKRIGHGLDILDEPHPNDLADMMAARDIAVEINLSSNRLILGVYGVQHPFKFYLHHHVPIVLSTDDEGILRTSLTNEYASAVSQFHLDYASLKQINRNTLTYGYIAGTSIWANAYKAKPVSECTVLRSQTCLNFIKNNPKATLQWQLEQNLIQFEQTWQ